MSLAQILAATAGCLANPKRARILLVAAVVAAAAALPVRPARADDVYTTSTGAYSALVGAYDTSGQINNPSLITLQTGVGDIAAYNDDIFVQWSNFNNFTSGIAEYTTSGALVNASLIPNGDSATVFNGNLLVGIGSQIAEYTTSGALINPSYIAPPGGDTGVGGPAFYGGDIFAPVGTGGGTEAVSEYNDAGQLINGSLITGLAAGDGFAVAGGNIFIGAGDSVQEYTLSGTPVGSFQLNGVLQGIDTIVASGNNLFFMMNFDAGGYGVAEYTTAGTLVNGQLVDGLGIPYGLTVVATPEPSTWILMALGALSLFAFRRRTR